MNSSINKTVRCDRYCMTTLDQVPADHEHVHVWKCGRISKYIFNLYQQFNKIHVYTKENQNMLNNKKCVYNICLDNFDIYRLLYTQQNGHLRTATCQKTGKNSILDFVEQFNTYIVGIMKLIIHNLLGFCVKQ